MEASPTAQNPLLTFTGTLKGIFQDVSESYFGFQNRVAALDLLEAETDKLKNSQAPADKAVPVGSATVNIKSIAIGAAVLLVAGIVVARMLK